MALTETIREDGLRVITRSIPGTKRVCVGVAVGFGSAYDPPEASGLAHFLEHMSFKSTATRSAKDISGTGDRYFLAYNASTDHLRTIYWGEAIYPHFGVLVPLLFDIYENPAFPESELAKERGVVNNEVATYEDSDDYKAHMGLINLLWKNSPLRNFGAGTPDSLNTIGSGILRGTHKTWYVPTNTSIIGVGRIDHSLLLHEISKALPLNFSPVSHPTFDSEYSEPPAKKEIVVARPGMELATVTMGCKLPPFDIRDQAVFEVLNRMMGGSQNSLLWQEIREKRGLAYDVSSHFDTETRRLGYHFCCQTEISPNKIPDTIQIMYDTICGTPLEREAFEINKGAMRDDWLVSMETPMSWMWTVVNKILNEERDISYLDKYVSKQRKMLADMKLGEIIELRRRVFLPENFAYSIVMPA